MSIKQSRHLYDILGISKDATNEEIRKTYKEKAVECHPDKGGDSSIFVELANAYNILIDKEKRKKYDETGYTGNQENDDKEVAFEVLRNFYMRVLSNEEELQKNIINILKDSIIKDIICCKDKCKKKENQIKKLNKTKNKIKYKGSSLDILKRVTEDEIEVCNQAIKNTQFQEYIDDTILKILDDYDYQENGD